MNDEGFEQGLSGIGVVVIGRNEGQRLIQCLDSVRDIRHCVYVDSGSTDGSVERAAARGVTVVPLQVPPKFTAARARNAGLEKLLTDHPNLEFVQTIDGDCELHPDWMRAASRILASDRQLALVFGRLRERYPERSIYNALCDVDWNGPVGESPVVGGIALFRVQALREVDFYNSAMIAGEEPELAMRLRKAGWRLIRSADEMGLHDVDIRRFGQWWERTRRTGHAYAELAHRHPDARNPNWHRTSLSIIFWGAVVPSAFVTSIGLGLTEGIEWAIPAAILLAGWLMQSFVIRMRKRRAGLSRKLASASGMLIMIGKVPQFFGWVKYHANRMLGRQSSIIEHKRPLASAGHGE